METVTVQSRLTRHDLLQAVRQLSHDEFEAFFQDVSALRDRAQAHQLSPAEGDLIETINQTLSPQEQSQYQDLIKKRQAETLTSTEHEQLITLSDRLDELHLQRITALTKLGTIRNKSLPEMMAEFGIPEHSYQSES